MKYTAEETKIALDIYCACETQEEREQALDEIAVKLNKTVHSVRAKLVAEEVYVSKERKSKITGGRPKSKEQMVDEMEKEFGFKLGELEGLEKAPKLVLVAIYNKLKHNIQKN